MVPLPPQFYLPAPPSQGFQGISGTHPGRHWLEASELWMERLLGPRRFYREQGDPKRKFQKQGVNPSVIQSSQIPALLLCLTDTSDHKEPWAGAPGPRGCNEGEFTPAPGTGQGNESSRELDQGRAVPGAVTQLNYTASL